MIVRRLVPYIVLVVALSCFVNAGSVFAATIYANSATGNDTTGDGSSGAPYKTFHKAYTEASASDTIDLTGTFDWTDVDETGDVSGTGYSITKDLTIQGQGLSTIIQADDTQDTADRRVFTIGSGQTVTIRGVTIRHGKNDKGGGISSDYSAATLYLEDCSIENNNAYGTVGSGGGIYMRHGSAVFTMTDCTVKDNEAVNSGAGNSYGGGLYLRGTATIIDSTIEGNEVGVWGSGIYGYYLSLTVTNSTIVDNTGWGAGLEMTNFNTGNLYLTNSTVAYNNNNGLNAYNTTGGVSLSSVSNVYIKNSILAQNIGGLATQRDWDRSGGTLNTNEYSIVETQSGSDFTNGVNNNIVGVQASLGLSASLADNSTTNLTETLALSLGSVAIDAGSATANGAVSVPTSDQRGLSRSGATDIGAYEYQPDVTDPTVSSLSPAPGASSVAVSTNLVMTFSESVDVESGNIVIFDASDNSIVETIDVAGLLVTGTGTATITIDPTANLQMNKTYYVQIATTAFDDAASNSYAGINDQVTWSFSTSTTPALTPTQSSSHSRSTISRRRIAWSSPVVTALRAREGARHSAVADVGLERVLGASDPTTSLPLPVNDFLRQGAMGSGVIAIQALLNKHMNTNLVLDGAFGPATEQIIRDFQFQNNIMSDGIVGPETLEVLMR